MKLVNGLASVLAANAALMVGSEMIEATRQARNERLHLAALCLASLFGLWACWEMLQTRQSLGLTEEVG